MTNKSYRKHLKEHSETVEQRMAAQDWNGIDYSTVPSVAMMRYRSAFGNRDSKRFDAFLEDKNAKSNAAVLQPHDIYLHWKSNSDDVAFIEKMWENLPPLSDTSQERILPMVDVSGSMTCQATDKLTCMDISISLGLYLSQQIAGPFKNQMLTFSSMPELVKATGTLVEQFKQTERMHWGGSTDLQAAYMSILQSATFHGIPQEQMPTMLLVLSDMQFNRTGSGLPMDDIKTSFEAAGYTAPKLVFWNLNARHNSSPASSQSGDVCLVSGFSAQVLNAALNAETLTPMDVLEEALSTIDIDTSMLEAA